MVGQTEMRDIRPRFVPRNCPSVLQTMRGKARSSATALLTASSVLQSVHRTDIIALRGRDVFVERGARKPEPLRLREFPGSMTCEGVPHCEGNMSDMLFEVHLNSPT